MWAVLHKRKLTSSQIILFGFAGVILVDNYDVCIVGIGNDFQSSLETTAPFGGGDRF